MKADGLEDSLKSGILLKFADQFWELLLVQASNLVEALHNNFLACCIVASVLPDLSQESRLALLS